MCSRAYNGQARLRRRRGIPNGPVISIDPEAVLTSDPCTVSTAVSCSSNGLATVHKSEKSLKKSKKNGESPKKSNKNSSRLPSTSSHAPLTGGSDVGSDVDSGHSDHDHHVSKNFEDDIVLQEGDESQEVVMPLTKDEDVV